MRDEESETQRKAHAKRVRETRRSTQGVTLEEIKSAEQIVKSKNQSTTNNNTEQVSCFICYKIVFGCLISFGGFSFMVGKVLTSTHKCLIFMDCIIGCLLSDTLNKFNHC